MSGFRPKEQQHRFDLASPARPPDCPQTSWEYWRDEASRHSDKLPTTHHLEPRCATQGVADPGVRHISTINSISHRRGREWKIPPSEPSDAGDRGHSKPVYLLPSSVQKRDSGTCAGATSQMLRRQHSHGPRVSRIRCGGICLQFWCRFQFDPKGS